MPSTKTTAWLITFLLIGLSHSSHAGWTNSSGGQHGSADAACKAMIDPGSAYQFSHTEPKPGDPTIAYCFDKPKEGKGAPNYIGALYKDEEPDKPAAEPAQDQPASAPGGPPPGGKKDKSKPSKDEIVKTRADVRTHLHHVFPQTFYKEFNSIGIDVDDYLMQLPVEKHIGKEGVHVKDDYNGQWEDFFNRAGKRTIKEAETYLIEILNEMGIASYPIGSANTGEVNKSGVK
jgi:hypothetical protein